MNPPTEFICETLVQVLGHSLWQAALIAGFVWLVLRYLPARRAELRYGLTLAGLASVVMGTFVTLSMLRLENRNAPSPISFAAGIEHKSDHTSDVHAVTSTSISDAADTGDYRSPKTRPRSLVRGQWPIAEGLSTLWLCGVVVMLGRTIVGHVAVRGLLAESTSTSREVASLEQLVKELRERLGLRIAVRIVVSETLSIPAVVGILWPAIVVPHAMVTGSSLEQWRIIIAHELAHIRRWDALVNLLQMVIESLLFFNPAVWWLSRQIRVEREACCDVIAAHACGQTVAVARTLVDVAAFVVRARTDQRSELGMSLPTLAFNEPANEGELTDRVRRLVEPNNPPRSRISWATLIGVLTVVLIAAVVIHRSTDLAIRVAANWMSPKERIEKLVQLEADQNGNILPADNGPVDQASSLDGQFTTEKEITVQVIVKTDDGSPVGPYLQMHSHHRRGNNTSGRSVGALEGNGAESRTTLHFPPGHLRIGVTHPGWADAISPIVALFPNSGEKTIELMLTSGRTVEAVVMNEHGEPIPFALVIRSTNLGIRGSSSGLSSREQRADDNGRIRFENIGHTEYTFAVQAPGYQRLEFKKQFGDPESWTEESPFVMTLKEASPTPVRVIDELTGKPIEQARLRIVFRGGTSNQMNFGFSRSLSGSERPGSIHEYGITDENGEAVLDQLQDGATYTFAVFAANYGVRFLETKPGQSVQIVKLSPALKISGRVTGAIERLQKQWDPTKSGYRISAYSNLNTVGHNVSENLWGDVDVEGNFTLDGLSSGERLTIQLPDQQRKLILTESISDLVLNIKPEAVEESVPRRDVIIRLTGTLPDAPARGSLYVSWQHPKVRTSDGQNGGLPLRGNEIRLAVPIGATLNVSDTDLVGYIINEQRQIEIQSGSGTQIVPIVATPAGGIHGTIIRADGTPAESAFVTVYATKLPWTEKDHSRINPSSSFAASKFLRSLPLGGRYCVLAREQSENGHVWAVSNEVTIDARNPIAKIDIQLPTGRDLNIKILDETGMPVAKQPIELELLFGLKSDSSTGSSSRYPAETDTFGVATFQRYSLDQPLGKIKLTVTAIVKPNPYRAMTSIINASRPIELRLKRGATVSGVVIDSTTNKPIPNATIRIHPKDFDQAEFKDNVTTTSDSEGRFVFKGLEQIDYSGHIEGASPKGTIVEPFGDYGLRFNTPPGVKPFELSGRPGSSPVRWEAVIHPNSELVPAR